MARGTRGLIGDGFARLAAPSRVEPASSSRSAVLERAAPALGELLVGNWGAFEQSYQRIQNDWLGPFTPENVSTSVLKRMREHSQLSLGLAARKAPFFGVEYFFQGGRPEVRAFVEKTLGSASPIFPRLLSSILLAIEFGYQTHEIIWAIRDVEVDPDGHGEPPRVLPRRYVIDECADVDPDRASEIKTDLRGRFAGVLVDGVQFLPAEKCLHVVHQLEWRNWAGRGDLRRSYPEWFMSGFTQKFAGQYFEQKSNPPLIGRAPAKGVRDETNPTGKPRLAIDLLGTQASSLRSSGVAILPGARDEKGEYQYDLKVLDVGPGRADQFISLLNWLNSQMLRGLGIPEIAVSQSTQTGSYGMAEEHANQLFAALQQTLVNTVLPAFNQLAERLVRVN